MQLLQQGGYIVGVLLKRYLPAVPVVAVPMPWIS
jgi:hypothetical protein